MYDLPYHKEQDKKVVEQFISEHPFALLTGSDARGRPVATQIPVFMQEHDGKKLLRGHLMRNTDHHKAFAENDNVLVVFTGSHVYVSGTWYRDPHIPSTWNYVSVHVRGKIRFLDQDALVQVLRETSLYFEDNNESSPTIYDNLPSQLTERLVKAIVAFEVQVAHIDTVFKLSQDRDVESYRNIIEKLKERGEDGRKIAALMQNKLGGLFPEGEGE